MYYLKLVHIYLVVNTIFHKTALSFSELCALIRLNRQKEREMSCTDQGIVVVTFSRIVGARGAGPALSGGWQRSRSPQRTFSQVERD